MADYINHFTEELIEKIPAGVLIANADWTTRLCNSYAQHFLRLHDYTPDELIQSARTEYKKTMASAEQITYTLQKKGESFMVDIYPRIASQEQFYLIVLARNAGAVEFDLFAGHSRDGLLLVDSEGILTYLSDHTAELLGGKRSDAEGYSVEHLQQKGFVQNPVTPGIMHTKNPRAYPVTYFKDTVMMLDATPVLDEHGNVEQIVTFMRDRSELNIIKRHMELLEQQCSKYQKMLSDVNRLYDTTELIYHSREMTKVMDIIRKIASLDSTVLITGETGVGKEVISQSIHRHSNRKDGPFIAINCATIPENLFESELFGYEKGAFTGANRDGKKGVFEAASGGTLFLDEIGEMPLSMQSKLLRVVQEGTFTRVGGTTPISVDVRIISATNLSQERLLDGHCFRQDLYYRLAIFSVRIPPLRDRPDDIDVLIDHFLKIFGEKYGGQTEMPDNIRSLFHTYDWPGNVRELRNMVERFAILYDTDRVISPSELISMLGFRHPTTDEYRYDIARGTEPDTLSEYLNNAERDHILQVLEKAKNVIAAAKALGISHQTLYRKMDKYNINMKK